MSPDYRPIVTDADGVPVDKTRLAERVFMAAPDDGTDPSELATLLRESKTALEARYRELDTSSDRREGGPIRI